MTLEFHRGLKLLLAAFVLTYLGVIVFNYGFIGVDEYWVAMVKYLPAQTTTWAHMVAADDVKSPSQFVPFFVLAKLGWMLGLENPFYQYRFVLAVITLIGCAVSVWSFWKLARALGSQKVFEVLLIIFTFHAVIPAAISRPMFESLSLPWLTLMGACCVEYDLYRRRKDLLLAVIAVCLAFAFRPQVGLCALVPVGLALWHKRWSDFALAAGLGLVIFALLGLPDIYYHGSYHYSLLRVFAYNVDHGADYGAQPWYYFLPLLFLFSYKPFFWARYTPAAWHGFKQTRSLYVILALFLLTHSLFANKFERFAIPIFGILVLMVPPFVLSLYERWPKYRWRFIGLAIINLPLWFAASFFPAQKNVIDLARHLSDHPAITKIQVVNEAVEWLPEVLMTRAAPTLAPLPVGTVPAGTTVLREYEYEEHRERFSACTKQADFPSTLLDTLAYKLNRAKNMRRAPLVLLECPGASS